MDETALDIAIARARAWEDKAPALCGDVLVLVELVRNYAEIVPAQAAEISRLEREIGRLNRALTELKKAVKGAFGVDW